MRNQRIPSKRLRLLGILMFFVGLGMANAQTVSGRVQDEDSTPLVGATVVIKGSSNGTTTDVDGQFQITGVSANAIIVISYTGYAAQEVQAGSNLVITLERSATLREVVVTAQKRSESVQSIPISIGVLRTEEIAQAADNGLDNLLRTVPGVEIQGLAQGAQIYVRGIGSSIDPTFADPAVALMVDGAYNGRTESVAGGVFDIERVEVLRGPQGTLYGRNASGGSINVITADPVLKNSGYVRAQLGNYSLWKIEAMGNAKLGDRAALRVAGFRQKRDGYIDDGSNNADNYGARAKLLLLPSDKLRIVAKADIYREGGAGQNTVPVDSSAGNLFFPPPFFVENFDPSQNPPFVGGPPILRFPNGWEKPDPDSPWSNNLEHPPGAIDRKSESFALQIDADLGFGTLTLLPTYTHTLNSLTSSFLFGSILPFQGPTYDTTPYGVQESENRYTSFEARLASSENENSKLSYLVGLYYLKSDSGDGELPGTSITSTGDMLETTNAFAPSTTLAGFGQLTYSLADNFRLTAGLRFSQDKVAQDYTLAINGSQGKTTKFEQNVNNFQYKVGFEFDAAEQSLLYGHVSTGFKQGGISPTFPPTPFEPEELLAVEVGSKNRLLNNKLLLNLSIFNYNYKNYQFSSFQTLPVGNQDAMATFIVIGNASSSNILGLELESEAILWDGGRLTASLTGLDAVYGKAVLPNNPFVNQGDFNLEDRQIQNAPKWTGRIAFDQGLDVGPGSITFGINTYLSTGFYVTPEQYLPGAYQDNYTRSGLSVGFVAKNKKWSIKAWMQNLENKAQTTYVFPVYRRLVTPPRTIGVNLEYNF